MRAGTPRWLLATATLAGAAAVVFAAVPALGADSRAGGPVRALSAPAERSSPQVGPAAVDPPAIVRPEDGDTTTTAMPAFSGEGVPGAAVELSISCGDETWSGTTEVDEEGGWAFTPGHGLPSGECAVTAVQSVDGSVSEQTAARDFTVDATPAADDGVRDGLAGARSSSGRTGAGDDDVRTGDEDGLAETGVAGPLLLCGGLALLAAGYALSPRRAARRAR